MLSLGSEYKYGVRISPIGGIHLEDMDFEVTTYVNPAKAVTFKKNSSRIRKIDSDSYMVSIDKDSGLIIGRGVVLAKLTLHIPNDADFEDFTRTEIYDKLETGWIIV